MIPDYVTVGGIVLDWIITAQGDVAHRACGGNCLYSAAGARIWHDSIGIVSRVAPDYPQEYLQAFADSGVDIRGIRRVDAARGLLFCAQYNDQGTRRTYRPEQVIPGWGEHDQATLDAAEVSIFDPRFVDEDKPFNALPDDVPDDFWKCRAFHQAGMRAPAQRAFTNALHQRGIPFTLDSGRHDDEFRALLEATPVFLPSEAEVEEILGSIPVEDAPKKLATMGPRIVAVKLGAKGSLVYDARNDTKRHVPAYPAKVKDPTGAGDSYCGGFLVGWMETGDAFEAALRGTVSSSFIIEDFDARHALAVSRADAEARLRKLRTLAE